MRLLCAVLLLSAALLAAPALAREEMGMGIGEGMAANNNDVPSGAPTESTGEGAQASGVINGPPPPPSSETTSAPPSSIPSSTVGEGENAATSSAGAAPAEDSDSGQITIVDNSNHLNSMVNMRKKELLAQANKAEEKLKALQEAHQKNLDAYAREKKEEEAEKTEEAAKQKTKQAAEEGEKSQIREGQEKKAAEADTKKKAEEESKKEDGQKKDSEESSKSSSKQEADQKKAENDKTIANEQSGKKDSEARVKKLTDVKLDSSQNNYGGDYLTASLTKVNRVVFVQGLISGSSGGLLATLPEGYRPTEGRLIFTCHKGVEARVDVLNDGRIYHVVAGTASWTSLNQITFDTDVQATLELGWSWVPYGDVYRRTSQTNDNGLCVISGLIRSGYSNYYGRTGQGCWPNDGQLIFSGNNHDHISRVDIRSDGYLLRNGGYANYGWVSFDGIVYPSNRGTDLSLVDNWSNYYSGYRTGAYARIGNICSLSGLIRNSWWSARIAVLPAGCRPSKRIIFGVNVHDYNCRVDILPDGTITYVDRRSQWDWISLSGITFVAAQ